jgi:hypothetical protein
VSALIDNGVIELNDEDGIDGVIDLDDDSGIDVIPSEPPGVGYRQSASIVINLNDKEVGPQRQ